MRPSNLPGSVAPCKNLDSVAIAPQLLKEIRKRQVEANWPPQVRMTQPVPAGALTGGMCLPQSLKHQ
jgi:hypothetical protein